MIGSVTVYSILFCYKSVPLNLISFENEIRVFFDLYRVVFKIEMRIFFDELGRTGF